MPKMTDLAYSYDKTEMPSMERDHYPCLCIKVKKDMKLPEGDFTFMARGYCKKVEHDKEEGYYEYRVEVKEMGDVKEVADKEDKEMPEKPERDLMGNFDDMARGMMARKGLNMVAVEEED